MGVKCYQVIVSLYKKNNTARKLLSWYPIIVWDSSYTILMNTNQKQVIICLYSSVLIWYVYTWFCRGGSRRGFPRWRSGGGGSGIFTCFHLTRIKLIKIQITLLCKWHHQKIKFSTIFSVKSYTFHRNLNQSPTVQIFLLYYLPLAELLQLHLWQHPPWFPCPVQKGVCQVIQM